MNEGSHSPTQNTQSKHAARNLTSLLIGGHGRPLGTAVLIVLSALSLMPSLTALSTLRITLFDAYQRISPRVRASAPATIIAIDEKSLQELGQWPWPRTIIAELIDAIGKSEAAAIGVDVLMPEPDRMSPASIAPLIEKLDPKLAERLARLPSNDNVLAAVLGKYPVALGIAGVEKQDQPDAGRRTAPFRIRGSDPVPHVRHF
ncbi:MAG: CHASE2 domain-containing protein, partial [Betaproteobacteria bacterium]